MRYTGTIGLLALLACGGGTVEGDGDTGSDAPPTDTTEAVSPAMAVTIDDLPWVGASKPGEARGDALGRLARALADEGVPAMGFVNCERAGGNGAALRPWLDEGLEIGNHTAAHLDLNDAPLIEWLSDARSCHDVVRDVTDAERIWFRYPFLHQGPTAERQDAALQLLNELDSPIAHVTIDNSDWILAVAYGDAVAAGDSATAVAVADAFIDHILRAVAHYRSVAQQKVGREVPHVLLLHANLLVTDHIDTLLERLRTEQGFRFISVAEAHEDPIYQLPDEYTGDDGLSWLYRMQPASPELKSWDDTEAQRLRERWR